MVHLPVMTSRYGEKGSIHTKSQVVDKRKQWMQYKNVENWITGTAIEAASEHQWHDAETLLPCLTIRSLPVTPADFLFKLIHTVLVNTHHDTSELDQYFIRNSFMLGGNHFELSLTALAEEIIGGTQEGVDSLFEMVDDFHSKFSKVNKSRRHEPLQEQEHWQNLVWSYKGVLLYSKWKSMKKEKKVPRTKNIFDTDSQVTDISSQMLSQMSASSGLPSSRALAQEAYDALHKSVENSQPCEWLLIPYLELKKDLEGESSVLEFLQEYVNKFNDHLPAYLFAYHFMKKNIPMSEDVQRVALQGISRMNPENPLVLTYVEDLLKLVTHNQIGQANTLMSTDDSGLEDEDVNNTSSGQENSAREISYNPTCILRREKVVETLISCIRKVKNLIEYKQWHWNVEPWRMLTNIFRKIHKAWICCWYCSSCIISRRKMSFLSRNVLNLWRITFWTILPESLTRSVAEVLMHSAYASHMFNYDASFVKMVIIKLQPEFSEFAEELKKTINMKGKFATKYMEYRSRKAKQLGRSTSFWNIANFSAAQEPNSAGKEGEVRSTDLLKKNTGVHEIVNSADGERLRLLEMRLTGSLQTRGKIYTRRQEGEETPRACVRKHNEATSVPGQTPVISRFTPLLSDESSSEFQPPKRKFKAVAPEKCKSKVQKKVKPRKQGHKGQVVKEKSKSTKSVPAELTSAKVSVHKTNKETVHQLSEDLLLEEKNQGNQKKLNSNTGILSESNSISLLDYSHKAKEQVLENELGNQEIFLDEQVITDEDELLVRDNEKIWCIGEKNDVNVPGENENGGRTSPCDISSKDPLCSDTEETGKNIHSGYSHLPHSQEHLKMSQNRRISTRPMVVIENLNPFDHPVICDKDCSHKDGCENEGEENEAFPVNSDVSSDIQEPMEMEGEVHCVDNEKTSNSLSLIIENVYCINKGADDGHNSNSEVSDNEIITSSLTFDTSLSPKLTQFPGPRRQSVECCTGTNMNVMSTVSDSQPFPLGSLEQFRVDMKNFDHSTPVEKPCRSGVSTIPVDLPSYAELARDNDCEVEPEKEYCIINNNEDCALPSCSRVSPALPCQCHQTNSSHFDESDHKNVPKCDVCKQSEVTQNKTFLKSFDFNDLPFPFGDEISEPSKKKKFTRNSKDMDGCLIVLDKSLNVHYERKKKSKKKKERLKKIKSRPKDNLSREIANIESCSNPISVGKDSVVFPEVSTVKNVEKERENKSKTDKARKLQEAEGKCGKRSKQGKSGRKHAKLKQIHLESTKETGHGNTNTQEEIQIIETEDKKKSKVKYKKAEFGIGVVCSENKLEMCTNRKKEHTESVDVPLQHKKEGHLSKRKVMSHVSGENKKTKSKEADAAGGDALVSDVVKKSGKKEKKKIHKFKKLNEDEVMPLGKGISKNMGSEKQKRAKVTQEIDECHVNTDKCNEICALVTNIDEAVGMNSEQIPTKKVKKKSSKIYKDGISDKPRKSIDKNKEHSPTINSKGGKCSENEDLPHGKTVKSHSQCSTENKIKSKQKSSLENAKNTDMASRKNKSKLKQNGEGKVKKAEHSSAVESTNQEKKVSPKSKAVKKKVWCEVDYFSDLPFPFPT